MLLITSLLSLMIAVTASSSYQKHQKQCQESGMCSFGLTKRWGGDIRPSKGLRNFLESVTYKQELILICYQRYMDYLEESAIHLHYELENLGFGHHAFLGYVGESNDGETVSFVDSCKDLTSIALSISCVWDSTVIPDWILSGEDRLWHYRWKTMARTIRLGYNVLSVDLDTMFFRGDFYSWLKQPPLKDMNLICNPEDGPANMPSFMCNGGWIYVQNARPNGPVAWVWKEVAWNLLRRADDHYEYLGPFCFLGACYERKLEKRNCQTFDQSWIHDAIMSAASGLRLSPNLAVVCKEGYNFTNEYGEEITTATVQATIESIADPPARMNRSQEIPESILKSMGFLDLPEYDKTFAHGVLTVPNLAYGFPEMLGGRGWPEGPQGNFSLDFERMLKEDCPDCPWWDEDRPMVDKESFTKFIYLAGQEVSLDLLMDPKIEPERFALTPKWMASGLLVTRRGTIVGLNSVHQGYPTIAHVHRWLTMGGTYFCKLDIRKLFGRYNWTLAAELAKKYGYSSVYSSGRFGDDIDASRLLALSPSIDLSRTRTWAEVASILLGLFQVAHLSDRVAVIPQIPCKAPWLRGLDLSPDDVGNLYGSLKAKTVHQIMAAMNAMRQSACHGPEQQSDETEMDLFYPVDSKGELIGGWARRQRRLLKASKAAKSQETTMTNDHHFWRMHRHHVADLYMFSEFCIRMPAMLPPELSHWLKHDEVGKKVKAEPSESNTVFRVAGDEPQFRLNPQLLKPSKGAIRASSEPRWSWYDVTASLPSADVVEAMGKLESEPLVFMDHPVLVRLDSKRIRAFAESIAQAATVGEVCPLILNDKAAGNQTEEIANLHHGLPSHIDPATRRIKIGGRNIALSAQDIQKMLSNDPL